MSPKHQERRFAKRYAETLLSIAEGDFRTARFAQTGVDAGEVRPENVFFLYQQSIEKLLKAVLCHLERPVPMVHDLGVLLAKLPDETQPGVGYEIAGLNDFAGIRRYEEGSIAYEPEDIDDARALTEELLAWARSIVSR